MSRHERYETRDRTYSNWHRYACSDDAFMVDVDGLESCNISRCRQPLLLVESARDVGQAVKPATALIGLAKVANIPAVILLWTPSPTWLPEPPHCECQRTRRVVSGCDHGVASFRARHIAPENKPWKRVDAAAIAAWIDGLHNAHKMSHHSTIATRTVALEAEVRVADPVKEEDWPEVARPGGGIEHLRRGA
jgi:hypothetical protein